MAEHLLSSAASAVTGELARVVFSGLMGKLVDGKKAAAAAAADKKLRRLDMLLIKINSAVEASEKHAIGNAASLVKWRDRLKEAAAEGDEVLASFRRREMEAAAAAAAQAHAQATSGDGDGDQAQQHQRQEDPSSSSSSASAAAASTVSATAITGNNSNAPSGSGSGMAQGIFGATKTLLFSREEDMERLDDAVERLEELSHHISIFIKLLKLEILAPAPAPPAAAPAPEELIWTENIGNLNSSKRRACWSPGDQVGSGPPMPRLFGIETNQVQTTAAAEAAGEVSTLLGRLEEAFVTICRAVELADGRDLSGYEWLAYWASILREAKRQGCAVLGGAVAVDDQLEDSELGRFVSNMESLAREAESFSDLACLCPPAAVVLAGVSKYYQIEHEGLFRSL